MFAQGLNLSASRISGHSKSNRTAEQEEWKRNENKILQWSLRTLTDL